MLRGGIRAAQRRRGWHRVDDVAERAEPHDQDIHSNPRIFKSRSRVE